MASQTVPGRAGYSLSSWLRHAGCDAESAASGTGQTPAFFACQAVHRRCTAQPGREGGTTLESRFAPSRLPLSPRGRVTGNPPKDWRRLSLRCPLPGWRLHVTAIPAIREARLTQTAAASRPAAGRRRRSLPIGCIATVRADGGGQDLRPPSLEALLAPQCSRADSRARGGWPESPCSAPPGFLGFPLRLQLVNSGAAGLEAKQDLAVSGAWVF